MLPSVSVNVQVLFKGMNITIDIIRYREKNKVLT